MQKLLLIVSIFLFQYSIYGQLNIGLFPINYGDNLEIRYSVDCIDKEIINQVSAHATWDISDSDSPLQEEVLIRKYNHFYNLKDVYEVSNGIDKVFCKRYGKNFDEVGFEMILPNKKQHIVKYNNPLSFSTTSLIYGAISSDSTSFHIDFVREDLPDKLQTKLPKNINSIKLIGNIKRRYHCDAHGNFILENNSITALRVKVIQDIDVKLYDVNSGDEIPFLNLDTKRLFFKEIGETVYYLYYSNISKHFFAKAIYSDKSDGYILKFQKDNFKREPLNFNSLSNAFYIYPNPTFGDLKLFINNDKKGKFNLGIYNIIGKKIWNKDIVLNGNDLFRYDFSFLRKGTYLIAIKDKYDNIVSVKKLIILSI